jgi:hypothetical protein
MRHVLLKNFRSGEKDNRDAYTGTTGLLLSLYLQNDMEWKRLLEQHMTQQIPEAHPSAKIRVTFLTGGSLSLHVLESLFHSSATKEAGGSGSTQATMYDKKIIELFDLASKLDSGECELLYGRAGFLQGLLFYRQERTRVSAALFLQQFLFSRCLTLLIHVSFVFFSQYFNYSVVKIFVCLLLFIVLIIL